MHYETIQVERGGYSLLTPYNQIRDEWVLIYVIEPFDELGYAKAIRMVLQGKPKLEDIKRVIIEWHNGQINMEILSGHKWRDMAVWLSAENQQNYKASFDLAMQFGGQGGTLPLVYKFGSELEPVYHQFNDLDELKDFYLSTVVYVKDTLANGWKRKDDIDWTPYEQALQAYR